MQCVISCGQLKATFLLSTTAQFPSLKRETASVVDNYILTLFFPVWEFFGLVALLTTIET